MTDTAVSGQSRIYVDLIGDLFHTGHLRPLEKPRRSATFLASAYSTTQPRHA
jgi:hypothetical protein